MNAIANLSGKIFGSVEFIQQNDEIKVIVSLQGFDSNSPYAMHIHEFGDLSQGCMSCGGHFKKNNQIHGIKTKDAVNIHAGDLKNNIYPDDKGFVNIQFITYGFQVSEIFGRSLMIHQEWDDCGQQGVVIEDKFYTYEEYANKDPKSFQNFFFKRYGEVKNFKNMINHLTTESLITGNAGGRMACAVIGRKKDS